MTDTVSPENDSPVADFSADEAKYEALAAKYAEREPAAEPEQREEPQAQAQEQEEPKENKRPPLSAEELEKRYRQTQAAMKEERRKRQELEEKLAKADTGQAQQDQIVALIESLREDDEDPIEDITSLKKVLREFANRQKAEAEQERAQTQQMTAFQRFASTVSEAEAEFRETAPDYDDAQAFFKDSLKQELEALGLEGDELNQEFARQVTNVAQQAINRGKNPAEVVYQLASRRGYGASQKGEVAPKTQEKPHVNQDAVDKAAEVIEKINKAQQASKSLSSAGASSGQKELTLSSVSKMSGKDLLQGYKALKEQAKRTGSYR